MPSSEAGKVTRKFGFVVEVVVDPSEDPVDTVQNFYQNVNKALVVSPYRVTRLTATKDISADEQPLYT